ncbi:MAG: hypothetical protein ABIR06_00260 [Cyclobacteriaceae bacterium]
MEIVIAEFMKHKLCDQHTRHHPDGQTQVLIKVKALFLEIYLRMEVK